MKKPLDMIVSTLWIWGNISWLPEEVLTGRYYRAAGFRRIKGGQI